ncbi:hypothetical protein PENTCL1PPCAC_7893, partial [Pristionchus entomophagus]
MAVEFIRQIGELQNETQERGAMCNQVRDGKRYVYRIIDVPEKDGILVDATESQLEGLRLKAVHRGKIIYERPKKQEKPSIEKLSENVVVIGSVYPGYDFGYVDSSSRFIHNMIIPTLEVFDMEKMEAHAVVAADLPEAFYRVAGIHEGKITVQAGSVVFSAQLPEKYI